MSGTIVLLSLLTPLAIYFYYCSTAKERACKKHVKKVRELHTIEQHYRQLRNGYEFAASDEEIKIIQLSEYKFERLIYNLWNDYEYGYEVAKTGWNEYLQRRRFERKEGDSPTLNKVEYFK